MTDDSKEGCGCLATLIVAALGWVVYGNFTSVLAILLLIIAHCGAFGICSCDWTNLVLENC